MPTSVTELPFNRLLGLQTAEAPAVLCLPAGDQYLNHLGTVHASAQLALAEASSGEFLLRIFGSTAGSLAVVRRIQAKFHKSANGAITSTVAVPAETVERFRRELNQKNRALIGVAVEIRDESGAHTLSALMEWFVTQSQ